MVSVWRDRHAWPMERHSAPDVLVDAPVVKHRHTGYGELITRVVLSLICLAAGAIGLAKGIGGYLDSRALDERGVTVQAELVDVSVEGDDTTWSDLTVRF